MDPPDSPIQLLAAWASLTVAIALAVGILLTDLGVIETPSVSPAVDSTWQPTGEPPPTVTLKDLGVKDR